MPNYLSRAQEAEKKRLFDQAIKTQTDIMVQNILGEGIDIHLLGLREMGKEMGYIDLEIFDDPSYKTANHFALSTSQVKTIL
jgi:choline O-acetyltransferase